MLDLLTSISLTALSNFQILNTNTKCWLLMIDFSRPTMSGTIASLSDCLVLENLTDTEKRQYLTSKVNSLFSLKCDFMRTSGDKKKLPIRNDEESSIVAEPGEISNLDLIKDVDKIVKLLEVFLLEHQRE